MPSRIHEFDLVADHRQIVWATTSTKRAYEKTFGDCIFLSKIEAKKKNLVLIGGSTGNLGRNIRAYCLAT
jgi:hypothetical protein